MLYLHGGWPKTGTTSLQAALVNHRGRLAASGLLYPRTWQGHWGDGDDSHHGLFEQLKDEQTVGAALRELERLREAHGDSDILVSCETFTLLLGLLERQEPALRFLTEVRETMPVTCIWTLRRFDELRRSLYLQFVSFGYVPSSPDEFMNDDGALRLFARMRELEECVDKAIYLEYDDRGSHNVELLRALDMPGDLFADIARELIGMPQLNQSLSHKRAVALLNFDALEARAGVRLDKDALWESLRTGALRFEGDGYCDLVDGRARWSLHERALKAAGECGFAPYADFFAAEQDEGPSEPVSMGPDALTDGDLNQLVRFCSRAAHA